MGYRPFLTLLALLVYTINLSSCLTCDESKGLICSKTELMTGDCVDGQCACVKGFFPHDCGCREYPKPVLENVPKYTLDFPNLKCSVKLPFQPASIRYKLYVAGEEIQNSKDESFRETEAYGARTSKGLAGPLTCSYTIGDFTATSQEVPYPNLHKMEIAVFGTKYINTKGSSRGKLTCKSILGNRIFSAHTRVRDEGWFKDGIQIGRRDEEGLTVTSKGSYICVVSLDGKYIRSPPFEVKLVDATVSITESKTRQDSGTPTHLECHVDYAGEARIQIRWQVYNYIIPRQNGTILDLTTARFLWQPHNTFQCHVSLVFPGEHQPYSTSVRRDVECKKFPLCS